MSLSKEPRCRPWELGTWQLSGKQCYETVRAALDLGYRHIDTAEMYANDEQVGRAIRESGHRPQQEIFPHHQGAAWKAPREGPRARSGPRTV